MFVFLSVIAIGIAIAIFIAGILTVLRNPKRYQNQTFFLLAFFIAVWMPLDFFDNNIAKPISAHVVLKFDFSLALLIGWALTLFVDALVMSQLNQTKKSSFGFWLRSIGMVANVALLVAIFSDRLAQGSIMKGVLEINYAHIIYYTIPIAAYFGYAIIKLLVTYFRSEKSKRRELNLIIFGISIGAIANILTNLVFPLMLSNHALVKDLNIIGYAGLLMLALCIYVAITTQKLFDIRSYVVRSLGYLLTFAAVSFIYVTPVLLFTALILNSEVSVGTIIFLTLMTLLASIVFHPVRQYFNKITNRTFFRDYYEPQLVLNQISDLLVGTIDAKYIIAESTQILQKALHAQFVAYLLSNNTTGSNAEVLKQLLALEADTVFLDDLQLSKDEPPIYRELYKQNAAVLVKLRTTQEDLGFMLLGHKQSGSLYSTSDKHLLRIAADEIAISLQNSFRFQQIQKFNQTLEAKIEEATKELQEANSHLKELDKVKDDFLSMATHQLDTPLVAIDGYLSMVETGITGPVNDKQHNFLDQARYRLLLMKRLVADFLNVSRMEVGRFVIEAAPTDVNKVVIEEVEQLQHRAKDMGVTLTLKMPTEPVPVIAIDEQKTRQAIMNLIDNSIHYSPKGNVNVSLEANLDDVIFKVVDNGIGVPLVAQAKLFSKYFRADNAKTERPNGNGIGLYLVKRVIEDQGGSIIFQSAEGKGSTFGFRLPLHVSLPKPKAAPPPTKLQSAPPPTRPTATIV
jgi:signal transduction histidine kinase